MNTLNLSQVVTIIRALKELIQNHSRDAGIQQTAWDSLESVVANLLQSAAPIDCVEYRIAVLVIDGVPALRREMTAAAALALYRSLRVLADSTCNDDDVGQCEALWARATAEALCA